MFIPRMNMSPFDSPWPFKLIGRQFPFTTSFAMTINKLRDRPAHVYDCITSLPLKHIHINLPLFRLVLLYKVATSRLRFLNVHYSYLYMQSIHSFLFIVQSLIHYNNKLLMIITTILSKTIYNWMRLVSNSYFFLSILKHYYHPNKLIFHPFHNEF